MKSGILGASKILADGDKLELVNNLPGRGSVYDQSLQGQEIYVEVGLLTEAEMTELIERVDGEKIDKLKTTDVKSFNLKDHLGCSTTMYLVSLRGIPCSEIHGLRRMKVFCSSIIHQDKILLEAHRQLQAQQHNKLYEHHVAKHISVLPAGFHNTSGFKSIQTLADIQGKVERKKQRLAAAEMAAAVGADSQQESEADSESEGAVIVDNPHQDKAPSMISSLRKNRRRKGAATAGTTGNAPNEKGTPIVDVPDGQEGDLDPELLPVAERLGNVPPSFLALNPEKIMSEKRKCGRSLDGATCLFLAQHQ